MVVWSWYVDNERRECDDLEFAAAMALGGQGFIWVGMLNPTEAEMEPFVALFDLHPLAVDDVVHGHHRSKLEQFGETLFTVVSTVAYTEHASLKDASEIVSTGQLMVFTGKNFVLTIRRGGRPQMKRLRARVEADPDTLANGPWGVLYAVLEHVIDDYRDVVNEIEQDVEEVEEIIFGPQGNPDIERAYMLKRELIEFRRSVTPLTMPLSHLATKPFEAVPAEARAYFRELSDHHLETRESLATFDELLTNILQAALARIGNADNQDMRKISAAVAILAVPTTIAAIYGMNFEYMPELRWQYGYFLIIGITLILMALVFWFFRRNKWL